MSAWKIYPEIKGAKVQITHNYTRRLLYDRFATDLMVEVQLEEDLDEEGLDVEEEILET